MFKVTLVTIILLVVIQWGYASNKNEYNVTELAHKWAPLIWLHSDEKFYPSSVEFFMPSVDIYDENMTLIQTDPTPTTIVTGQWTASLHMQTKVPLGAPNRDLLNDAIDGTSYVSYAANERDRKCRYWDCPACTNVPEFSGESVENGGVPTYTMIKAYDDVLSTIDISYEAFYPYNRGKQVCIGIPVNGTCEGYEESFGNHVGDWEHFSIRLQDGQPIMAYLSVHSFGAFYIWNGLENRFDYFCGEPLSTMDQCSNDTMVPYPPHVFMTEDGHPIAFSANGSHGLWAAEGEYEYMRLLGLTDYTNPGISWNTWENLVIVEWNDSPLPEHLQWIGYLGSWGNEKDGCGVEIVSGECILGGGPGGPEEPNDFPTVPERKNV